MKKSLLSLLAAGAALSLSAASGRVTDVVMSQEESSPQAVITYTLQDAASIVTVDILTNGVSIGAANLKYFAGDVNCIVQPGSRRMTWRPGKAWPGHRIMDKSVTAKVTAWALNAPPDIMVVDLAVTNGKKQFAFYADVESLPGEGGVSNDLYKTDKMVFRKCPAANVQWRMGSSPEEVGYIAGRQVAHLVTLTNDFYLGVYEVTQRQFTRFTERSASNWATFKNADDSAVRPMENLSWVNLRMHLGNEIDMNYNWPEKGHAVGEKSVLGFLRTKTGDRLAFDLPTEAQWEFACRAGTGSGLYTGREITAETGTCPNVAEIACYKGNSDGQTMPVGSFLPNDWGFYDMIGNVMEICLDNWKDDLSDVDPETGSPDLAANNFRANRGGSYNSDPRACRSAYRYDRVNYTAKPGWTGADSTFGFRIAAPAEFAADKFAD